ncbi:hypothetical protein D3C78_1224580 [compost metagenome]
MTSLISLGISEPFIDLELELIGNPRASASSTFKLFLTLISGDSAIEIITNPLLFFTRFEIFEIIAVFPEPPGPTTSSAGAFIRSGTSAILFIMRNTASLELLSTHSSWCMALMRVSTSADRNLRISGLTCSKLISDPPRQIV